MKSIFRIIRLLPKTKFSSVVHPIRIESRKPLETKIPLESLISSQDNVEKSKNLFQEYLTRDGQKERKVFDAFAKVLVRDGDLVAAIKLVTEVQQSFGLACNVSQLNLLMSELLSLGEVDDCLELYELVKSTDTFPNLNDESDGYMISALAKSDFDKARGLFNVGKNYKNIGKFGVECIRNGDIELAMEVFEKFGPHDEELFLELCSSKLVTKGWDWFIQSVKRLLRLNLERRNVVLVTIQKALDSFTEHHGSAENLKKILTATAACEIRPLAKTSEKILEFWNGSGDGLSESNLRSLRVMAWDVPEKRVEIWKKLNSCLIINGILPDSKEFARLRNALNLTTQEQKSEFFTDWKASCFALEKFILLQQQETFLTKIPDLMPSVIVEILTVAIQILTAKKEQMNPNVLALILNNLERYNGKTQGQDDIKKILSLLVNVGPSILEPNKIMCFNLIKLSLKFKATDAILAYASNETLMTTFILKAHVLKPIQEMLEDSNDRESLKKLILVRLKVDPGFTLSQKYWDLFTEDEAFQIAVTRIESKGNITVENLKCVVGKLRNASRIELIEQLWDHVNPVLKRDELFARKKNYKRQVYKLFTMVPSRAACAVIVENFANIQISEDEINSALEFADVSGLNDLASAIRVIKTRLAEFTSRDPIMEPEVANAGDKNEDLIVLSKEKKYTEFFQKFDVYVERGGVDPFYYNLAIKTLAEANNPEAVKIIWKEMTNKNLRLSEEALTAMVELLATVPHSTGYISRLSAGYEFNERQKIALMRSHAADGNIFAVEGILESANTDGTISSSLFSAAIQAVVELISVDAAKMLIDYRLKASNVSWNADLYRNVLKVHQLLSENQEAIELFDRQVDEGLVDTGSLEIMREIATTTNDKLLLNAVLSIQGKIGSREDNESF